MINKHFLEEPNILDMSKEIFNSVVDENLKVETRFQLLSSKIQDAETVNFILAELAGSIQSGLSYTGARNIGELQAKASFIRQTDAGQNESSAHILKRYR